jgi:hypothetical protein
MKASAESRRPSKWKRSKARKRARIAQKDLAAPEAKRREERA